MNNSPTQFELMEANLQSLKQRMPDLPVSGILLCRLMLHIGREMATIFERDFFFKGTGATESSGKEGSAGADVVTGARNRYPRRGTVSMKRGLSEESPSAVRSFLIAVFSPSSNSTNVSAVQSF